ncbi:cell division protein FtsH [Williamsoniiplasma luminosum]|uniref:ATP-dependent zinc metalloprotease FtsH n=1 Tax=Williamsoniiplasma luminosum TaxID=214888 RepID=A0A2K8NTI8_9MOLU|nr:ATP-dependent zinc metalloprotease FtsH [Williamsoniiplasma luminosum]ATZ16876.1 cell division protein FtsH [Williamsoniiplasma luminosum]
MKEKQKTSWWFWLVLVIILAIIITSIVFTLQGSSETRNINWLNDFVTSTPNKLKGVKVNLSINGYMNIAGIYQNGAGNWIKFSIGASQSLLNSDNPFYLMLSTYLNGNAVISTQTSNWMGIVMSLLPILFMIIIFTVMYKSMTKGGGMGGGQGIFGMGKNRATQTKTNVKFSDVAGIEEEKSELIELVDYLKNPQKYVEAGARVPKGVLMEGPPGTGKTLLAKAVAGEAGVAFFSISGSEFEEMFVGVGASRVREMFVDAKKNAPCIIFIDEIDAVGRKRSASMGTGTSEQTLNQLLVEMDGFGTNSGVIVMAATNRSDVLDPALLRPGRFDRVIQVSLPDIREREAILKLHSRGKKIEASVDWHRVAERTPGFSGAQLENVLNEAAILMVRENKSIITILEIDEAIDRVVGGPAKKNRAMTKQDKKIVSYHESGHALIGLKLESASKVQKVTIIPRGNAGGYTIMTPKDETVFSSKKDLYAMIAGYLGGRAAEEIMFGKENVTTGAHDDLDKATHIARRMVVQFGMSSLGMTKFLTMAEESYGRLEGTYSDETASKIDKEIQKILDQAYVEAIEIINQHKDTLELLAESLNVLETITSEQIDYIDKEGKLPKEVVEAKERWAEESKKKESGDIIDIDLEDVKKEEAKFKKKSSETKTEDLSSETAKKPSKSDVVEETKKPKSPKSGAKKISKETDEKPKKKPTSKKPSPKKKDDDEETKK